MFCVLFDVREREGKGGTNNASSGSPHMSTFNIPTSPSITESSVTCLMPKVNMGNSRHPAKLHYGSLT